MTFTFVPELPPAKSQGGGSKRLYQDFREALYARPGEWAIFPGSVGIAGRIRYGAEDPNSMWRGYECAQRVVEGETKLFVRYVGPRYEK